MAEPSLACFSTNHSCLASDPQIVGIMLLNNWRALSQVQVRVLWLRSIQTSEFKGLLLATELPLERL